jgi:hypothetical protein
MPQILGHTPRLEPTAMPAATRGKRRQCQNSRKQQKFQQSEPPFLTIGAKRQVEQSADDGDCG